RLAATEKPPALQEAWPDARADCRMGEAQEANHWLRLQDIVAAERKQGMSISDSALATMRKEEFARFEQEQIALLGPAAFQEVKEYRRLLPVRTLANALAGNVFHTEPLTAGQGEQTARILAENSARYRKGGAAKLDDIDVEIAFAQLQTVLTPGQYA